MGHHADLLVQNDIDGKTLLTLNDEDMEDLGINDVRSQPLGHIIDSSRSPTYSRSLRSHRQRTVKSSSGTSLNCSESPKPLGKS
jgi:hypothetical protein